MGGIKTAPEKTMKSNDTIHRIEDAVEGLKTRYVRTLQELVRIPSVVGAESTAQRFMEELYRNAGLDVIRFTADKTKLQGHPAFIDTGCPSYENRPNIIGILAGDPSRHSLILNGHIDVVSPEPVQAWSRDPWGGEVEGDRLYGRGTGDMKAGLLANFFSLQALKQAGFRPEGTVMLQSVVDEESGGAGGTLACLMEGFTADGLLVTEPHHLKITISHAGIAYFRVTVKGKTAHAGLAHLGINAIGKMVPIYQALEGLDRIRGKEVHFPLYEKGSGRSCHLNVGTIRAGDWPSTVPGSATLECRIGFIPGETMAGIRETVESTILTAAARDPWLQEHPPEIQWFGWHAEPWYQDPGHPFVQALRESAEEVLLRPAEYIGRASGNDGRFSRYFNMPASCTGPVAQNIHGPDEYVEISSAFQLIRVLAIFILRWCGGRKMP
jgi:acetylornithine deacetylase